MSIGGYVYIYLSLRPSFFIEDFFASSYANDGWFVIVLYVFVLQIISFRKYFKSVYFAQIWIKRFPVYIYGCNVNCEVEAEEHDALMYLESVSENKY